MKKLVKVVKLNNLQYNANRDPEVYRRCIKEPFRAGTAKARFEVDGKTICEKSVSLPGTFDCEVSFDSAGIRLGMLTVDGNGESHAQNLRLDVMDHAWIG